MRPIATDVRGVCPSVCLSRSSNRLRCAKTAERIRKLFGVNTRSGLQHWVLISPQTGGRDVLLNFGTPLISPEPLKLETTDPIQNCTK